MFGYRRTATPARRGGPLMSHGFARSEGTADGDGMAGDSRAGTAAGAGACASEGVPSGAAELGAGDSGLLFPAPAVS